MNAAAECWILKWGETLVGFRAVLPQPTGTANYCKRGHRLVILPDYQGMGLGVKLNDTIAKMYVEQGYKMYCRSAHIKLAHYWQKTPTWRPTARNGKKGEINGMNHNEDNVSRECYSFEYVGEDFVNKPHLDIIVDELNDIDINEMRKLLVELKEKYYLTIIHGAVKIESDLNKLCLELGIRTELLYIHGKLSGKHSGKRKLSYLQPGFAPKYGIVGDPNAALVEDPSQLIPKTTKSSQPKVKSNKPVVNVVKPIAPTPVVKPNAPTYELIVDSIDGIDLKSFATLLVDMKKRGFGINIVHGSSKTNDIINALGTRLGLDVIALYDDSGTILTKYCGRNKLTKCQPDSKPEFTKIPAMSFDL